LNDMPRVREEPVEIRPIGVAVSHRWVAPWQRFWWGLVIGCAGCQSAAPLPPPAPPPPPPPVVEAPPPPKCEKVEEACVAGADTRARIAQVGWQFAPPVNWIYAQGEDLTIATGQNAVMGVSVHQVVDAKKERADREEALRLIVGQLGVTLPKKKSYIAKRPDKKQKVGQIDVDFYQFEGAQLDGRMGPVLFFVVKASNEQTLMGVGFVPNDDGDNADQAIMTAIESLEPSTNDAPTASKAEP
jgi:hypothetical protein